MTVARVTRAGTGDEDHAEYFDGHADFGELLDLLVDGAGADWKTKAKQKELDRVRGSEYPYCSGTEASYDTLGVGLEKVRNQGAILHKRVEGRRNDV